MFLSLLKFFCSLNSLALGLLEYNFFGIFFTFRNTCSGSYTILRQGRGETTRQEVLYEI
jgi:hypothetical protein